MSGFQAPNYTQAPNALFDDILPQIDSLAELKVTLVCVRQTVGFHKDADEISISRFVELTGLHKTNVIEGVRRALKRGTISRRKVKQTYLYSLNVVKDSVQKRGEEVVVNRDQQGATGSSDSLPEVVVNRDQQVVVNHYPQKKVPKEKKRKNEDSLRSSSAGVQKRTPPGSPVTDDHVEGKVISPKQYGITALMDRYNKAKTDGRSPAIPDEPYKRRTGDIYAAHIVEYEPGQLEPVLDKLIDCACGDGPGWLSGKKRWIPFVDALGFIESDQAEPPSTHTSGSSRTEAPATSQSIIDYVFANTRTESIRNSESSIRRAMAKHDFTRPEEPVFPVMKMLGGSDNERWQVRDALESLCRRAVRESERTEVA